MLIIVEGVDGVGKSTFVDRLATRLREIDPDANITKLKAGPPDPEKDILEEYELPLQNYVPGHNQHVICDRWHVGELIYGPMLRGKSLLDDARLRHLNMFLNAKGAYILLLAAPTHEIIKRRKERGELDLIGDGQVDFVQHRYMDLLFEHGVPTSVAVWGMGEDNEQILSCLRQGHKYQKRAEELVPFPTYVGPNKPAYLLVGERRNQNTDDRWDSAFVPVPTGNSGHYLLSHMTVEVQSTGLVNATECNLLELWCLLEEPQVVALGTVAHNHLEAASVPHGRVPHPQWVRRFAHAFGDVYGRMIRRAALYGEDLHRWRP